VALWTVDGAPPPDSSPGGAALDIERPTFDGVGRAQSFANGKFIVWHPELGPSVVFGAIAQKWLSLGREQFGYPITDELGCPDGRGRFNHFRAMQVAGHPVASIYWTPTTGPHEVHGAIREAWAGAAAATSSTGSSTGRRPRAPTSTGRSRSTRGPS
jgi:uncharacterized protein with LGFP repeats